VKVEEKGGEVDGARSSGGKELTVHACGLHLEVLGPESPCDSSATISRARVQSPLPPLPPLPTLQALRLRVPKGRANKGYNAARRCGAGNSRRARALRPDLEPSPPPTPPRRVANITSLLTVAIVVVGPYLYPP
jgi:hypothetical protein